MKRNTFVVIAIVVITILAATHAYSSDKKSGRGYIVLEVDHTDLQELNTSLQHNGYSRFSENIIGIGAGGHDVRKNRFIFEGYAAWYFPRYKNSTVGNVKYESSLSGILGIYNIGYLIYKKGGVNIFPLLGFGFGGMKMTVNERETRLFNEILESPRESTVDTGMMFLFNITIGVDKLFITKTEKSSEKGIGAGIRLGYRYCFYKQDWPNVKGGPDISFTGPYINFTFGGGYNKKK